MIDRKYVLCRPIGGLNDTLCQIEICRAYAAQYGRTLIVDGRASGIVGEFGDYFEMAGDSHIFDMSDPAIPNFDLLDCFPHQVQGRISTLTAERDPAPKGWRAVDAMTKTVLSFPMDRDHSETLLLHQQWGGGTNSFDLVNRLSIVPGLAQLVRDRIAGLPEGYCALHVRNTDYRTDVGMVIEALRSKVAGQDLLLCSDDPEVFSQVRSGMPDTRIHQITTPVFDKKRPQHKSARGADDRIRRQIATSSLVDLCALASASTLYLSVLLSKNTQVPLDLRGKNKLSGFSTLAAHLCENRALLRRFLGSAGDGFLPEAKAGRVLTVKTQPGR